LCCAVRSTMSSMADVPRVLGNGVAICLPSGGSVEGRKPVSLFAVQSVCCASAAAWSRDRGPGGCQCGGWLCVSPGEEVENEGGVVGMKCESSVLLAFPLPSSLPFLPLFSLSYLPLFLPSLGFSPSPLSLLPSLLPLSSLPLFLPSLPSPPLLPPSLPTFPPSSPPLLPPSLPTFPPSSPPLLPPSLPTFPPSSPPLLPSLPTFLSPSSLSSHLPLLFLPSPSLN
jgi:hypothetical protein